MKRIVYMVIIALSFFALCSCEQTAKQIENMSTFVTGEYAAIVWGDKTFVPFCAIPNNERGEQIGIVDADKNNQVYEYKGYSTDEWLVSYYDSGEMDSSMLMRELNVTEIPEGLISEYDWNKK